MTADLDFIYEVAVGYRLSQVLYTFVELNVAEQLAEEPRTLAMVATGTGSDPDALRRLLAVATTIGLVDRNGEGKFVLTRRGRLLIADADGSLSPLARGIGQPWQWATWGRLVDAIRTGEPVFSQGPYSNSFDFFDNTPHAGDALAQRMTVEARTRGSLIAQAFDFSAFREIVDVGGGQGGVLAQILRRHPNTRGTLTDLPYALAGAAAVLQKAGVEGRVRILPGDFRVAVPDGGDIYLLSAILHMLSDAEAANLVRDCLARAATVVVVDEVVDADAPSPTKLLVKDLQLMLFTRGRQRTLKEFAAVLTRAGASIAAVIEVRDHEVLMVCHPTEPSA